MDSTSPKPTLVAMSGGVDSSTVAALLAEAGEPLVGVFMRNGVSGAGSQRSCCSVSDARDARRVADRLGIPFYVHDMSRSFAELIDEFARDYSEGRTPNPCVVCNNRLKFGDLAELADDLGCGAVATGHYARLVDARLFRGADRAKDQSYLLHGLTRAQRERARFPLGDLPKDAVREHARRLGLGGVADKKDSADICFVPGGDYRAVVRERVGDLGRPGVVVHRDGRVLAEHDGVAGFTIGQRRGLGVAAGEPVYVTDIDVDDGTVTVAPAEGLGETSVVVAGVSWLETPAGPFEADVQLRHHHRPERARVEPLDDGRARVVFDAPSAAVCPGQYAVFYRDDEVLGGGRQERPRRGVDRSSTPRGSLHA